MNICPMCGLESDSFVGHLLLCGFRMKNERDKWKAKAERLEIQVGQLRVWREHARGDIEYLATTAAGDLQHLDGIQSKQEIAIADHGKVSP